ncbi:hypothetical protein Q7P35_011464 [Cladosporium inversicolor]
MAIDKASGAADMHCPDPSVHDKHNKLSEQASTAALYVTNPAARSERTPTPREDVLDSDGKLSSKSAAASLKYAKPQDLPSFPTVGISTSSAGAAAVLAKDYKGREIVRPDGNSAAGSKAALLAHKKGADLNLWQPTASKDGNSAAALAMGNKNLSPQLDRGYTAQGKSNALLAATKSTRDTTQRAGSTPSPAPALYPDQANSARNALNAATVSHRGSAKPPQSGQTASLQFSDPALQAARIQNIGKNVAPEMWTERPPVEIELEEARQKAALRASAVSMAKQMYEHQNRTVFSSDPSGAAGASAAHNRAPSTMSQPDLKQEALRYITLQDTAKKLANERLAKMDKDLETTKFREHYGYDAQPHRNRLSMRGRPRQRPGSQQGQNDDDDYSSDDERARRVRRQMNQLNSSVADVDAKKKEADRKALLAAAERNVHKSMNSMDEQVFQSTGKVSQAKMDEWAAKAREKAQKDAELRGQQHGKTHIGGGKFMDQAAIEAIAQSRLQPTLDAINDTAEKKRARDEEIRLDKEEQERQKRNEKQKHKEEKDEQKQIKQEEKAAAKKEKEERKAAEKAEKEDKRKSVELEGEGKPERKSLLSRLASKRKSRNINKDEADSATAGTTTAAAAGTTAIVSGDVVKTTEVPDATSSSTGDAEVVGAPISPVHTKDSSEPKTMPNLERHITNIETSSESESDNDETRLRKRERKAQKSAILAGATTAKTDDSEAFVSPNEGTVTPIRSRSIEPPPTASTTATKSSGELPNENSSTVATKSIAERVLASPVDAPRALAEVPVDAPTATTAAELVEPVRESTASSRPDVEKEKAQETKSSRGFFSRFRNRHSKADRQPGSFSGTSGKPTTAAATTTAAVPATAAVASSTDARAASPSSFTRRRHSSSDDGVATPRKSSLSLSDVSSLSSGLDEDDFQEGRTGRMARAENKKKTTGVAGVDADGVHGLATTGKGKGVRSDDDESDQFEEARDHFDEGLAPRPSFAGQAKSSSPARETRFKEEV